MYFKKLEIVGFKSFLDKTKLEFEPGVTAVVGPNGCGKSNVADAIKWVLGEQSPKSLRGSRMEDMIFSGTDAQEPINLAEVSLTLCNQTKALPIDYDEVTITRRLFRTGESEYLLNKTPVRLKDISELLMGTGIGTESYSMIEQGKIDMILSSKPEERRFVFEEASGITKYKAKKKEALRKLEHTENNLIRINDIINEVKRQLGYIEKQAKKAEKYKHDFEILKDLDLKYSFFEYKKLANEEKTASVESSDIRVQEKELSEEVSEFVERINGLRANLERLTRELFETQQKSTEAEASFDKNRHKIELNRERIKELEISAGSLAKEVEELRKKLESMKGEGRKIRDEFANWEKQVLIKDRLIQEREARINEFQNEIGGHQHDIKVAREKTLDLTANETRIKNELVKLSTDIQNKRARLKRLAVEKDNVSGEKQDLDGKFVKINQDFQERRNALNALCDELTRYNGALKEMNAELEWISHSLAEKRKEAEVLKSKEEMLKELIKKREGFDRAVKEVYSAAEDQNPLLRGVLGILADMISVEAGYEQCAESALGRMAQAIIVDTRENAKSVVRFLKERNAGDAAFIIYEEIKDFNYHVPALGEEAVPLSNFVKIKNGLGKIISYLFRDTYVVSDAESAEKIISRHKGDAKFVAKEGVFLERGFLLARLMMREADTVSILGREDRVKDIIKKKEALLAEIGPLGKKEKEYIEKIKAFGSQMQALERDVRTKEIELGNVESRKAGLEEGIKRLEEEISIIDMEKEDMQSQVEESTAKISDLNKELEKTTQESSAVQNLLATSQDQIQNKGKLREAIILEVADLREERSSIKTHVDNVESNLKRQESAIMDLEGSIDTRNKQIKSNSERCNELSDEAVELEAQVQLITSEQKFLEQKKQDLEKRKIEAAGELNNNERDLKQKESVLNNMRNEIRDSDVKRAEISFKKDNLNNRTLEAYKVSLDEINPEIDELADWEGIKQEIAELKERIEKMGPVNLVAIEEHKELEERYSFLTRQQEDLTNAKDSLHKAIIRINATTKNLFIEAFGKIQVEFKNYFRMLFGGGQAELVLLDEKDVLECGIEIVARPPGKKLQNILLLSGGEKALTAIALLFSIFKVKPSPFCILDEIDAPLDEANIERFSRVLREFLKMSQFIIITHNKKTIELADILYGITMEKKGISRVVSVKLRESSKENTTSTVFA